MVHFSLVHFSLVLLMRGEGKHGAQYDSPSYASQEVQVPGILAIGTPGLYRAQDTALYTYQWDCTLFFPFLCTSCTIRYNTVQYSTVLRILPPWVQVLPVRARAGVTRGGAHVRVGGASWRPGVDLRGGAQGPPGGHHRCRGQLRLPQPRPRYAEPLVPCAFCEHLAASGLLACSFFFSVFFLQALVMRKAALCTSLFARGKSMAWITLLVRHSAGTYELGASHPKWRIETLETPKVREPHASCLMPHASFLMLKP